MPDSAMKSTRDTVLGEEFKMLVGGALVDADDGMRLETSNPATGELLAEVPNGSPGDVDRAVAAAKSAQPAWRKMTLRERQDLLWPVASALREQSESLGLLDTLDTGNVHSAMASDAAGAAGALEYFIGVANEIKGEVTQLDNNLHYTRRQPFGVVARLLPFNHPIQSFGGALGPPLLTGNCLILKPSPHTPLSALAFARTLCDLLPPGVVNVVTGDNDRVARPLLAHPEVPRIALTGSTEAGQTALRLGADHIKTVTLELGGKTPMIVFPDADVSFAADVAGAGMNFKWQGQSCASTSRILVHSSLREKLVTEMVVRFRAVNVALPTDPAAQMGAISHQAQYDKIVEYISAGQAEGATLVTGGERPDDPALQNGLFLTPAVFANVKPHMRIANEEIYGPVVSILEWDDYDDMLKIANDVIYGLAAVIVTNDLNLAHGTAEALDVGYVEINGPVSFASGSPFGGTKKSGIGRDGNIEELLSYTWTKSVNVNLR